MCQRRAGLAHPFQSSGPALTGAARPAAAPVSSASRKQAVGERLEHTIVQDSAQLIAIVAELDGWVMGVVGVEAAGGLRTGVGG